MYKFILFLLVYIFIDTLFGVSQVTDSRKPSEQFETEERFLKAKYLQISGKALDAYRLLDTLRKENRENGAILYEMAKIKNGLGDYTEAEQLITQAIKLDAENPWYRKFSAEMSSFLGKNDDAAKSYSELIVLFPKKWEYYDELYNIYLKSGKYQDCLTILERMENQFGFSEQVVFRKAEIYDNTGKIKDAVTQIERLVNKYPGQVKYLKLIASMLKSNGLDLEALGYYKKILAITPDDTEAQIALLAQNNNKSDPAGYLTSLNSMMINAEIQTDLKIKELLPFVLKHADTSDPMLGDKLRSLCAELVKTHPDDAKAHAVYGDVLMNSGEYIEAVKQYQRTIELNERNYMVWEQWMFGLQMLQKNDELRKVADRAIDLYPNFPLPYYFAGMAEMESGNFKNAGLLLEEALQISLSDRVTGVRILTALSQLRLKENKLKEARNIVNEALSITNGKDVMLLELSGDIYFAESDIKNAVSKWKEALSSGSKSESLLIKLEKAGAN